LKPEKLSDFAGWNYFRKIFKTGLYSFRK